MPGRESTPVGSVFVKCIRDLCWLPRDALAHFFPLCARDKQCFNVRQCQKNNSDIERGRCQQSIKPELLLDCSLCLPWNVLRQCCGGQLLTFYT